MPALFAESMLHPTSVRLVESVADWEAAVRLCLRPLEEGGHVVPSYAEGVIANTREFGPYYVIAPGLAFVHGRPDQGVIRTQMAVTVLAQPVNFGVDNAPEQAVRLLVALAATDSESHLDALRSLALLFKDEARMARILAAPSAADAYTRFTLA